MSLLDLSPDVLACRSMGHAWYHSTDSEIRYRAGQVVYFLRVETCERCGAVRPRGVDLRAREIVRRSIRYPAGYLLHGEPRPTRVDALVADATRLLTDR